MSAPLLLQRDAKALARYGWQALLAGSTDAGVGALALAVNTDPSSFDGWLALGVGFTQKHQWNDAREAFGRACLLAPHQIEPWLHCAECALQQNLFSDVISCLIRCIEIDPNMSTAAGIRARVLAVKAYKRLQATQDKP
jgi:cytochrome c-type biogenesis protein CcmH/NrfG